MDKATFYKNGRQIPAGAGNKNLFYLCRQPKYQVRVSKRKKEK